MRKRTDRGRAPRYWGYRHENGTHQVRRYLSHELSGGAMDDAYSSPFVVAVARPFEATGRQQALDRCQAILARR